jgi:hypothetical protein
MPDVVDGPLWTFDRDIDHDRFARRAVVLGDTVTLDKSHVRQASRLSKLG